jgi:hypothetical protein
VVDDGIDHEPIAFAQGTEIVVPRAVAGIDFQIIHDGKAVVGGGRKKRQEVDRSDHIADLLVEEVLQHSERRTPGRRQLVRIDDQNGILVGEGTRSGRRGESAAGLVEEAFQAGGRVGGPPLAVKRGQRFGDGGREIHGQRGLGK